MEDLPEDVMFDILLRLPVKTIVSCKCVCKKWHNLVLDSYFANLHLLRPYPPSLMVHHLLSEMNFSKQRTLRWVETIGDLGHHHNRIISLDLDFDVANLFIVGSVNGLICVSELCKGSNKIYICNPITKEYLFFHKHDSCEETVRYGFGVSMAGDYKVIRLSQKKRPRGITEIKVYTLGTDQWRNVGQVPDCVNINYTHTTKGLSLNGRVHWFDCDIIYAFDLDSEIFQLIIPSPLEEGHKFFPFMGVLKGCLSLLSQSHSSNGFYDACSVWVMKENGIDKSWHKMMKIKGYCIPPILHRTWDPLCLIDGLNDTSILIVADKEIRKLVAYTLETSRVEETEICAKSYGLMNLMIYLPSFVKLRNFESERVHVFPSIKRKERNDREEKREKKRRSKSFGKKIMMA